MVLDLGPPEMMALGTPRVSNGTKNFWSIFFSRPKILIIFYAFCGFVLQKWANDSKDRLFYVFVLYNEIYSQKDPFLLFFAHFCKTNLQTT